MWQIKKKRMLMLGITSLIPMIALPIASCAVNSDLKVESEIDTQSVKANEKAQTVLASEVNNTTILKYIEFNDAFTVLGIIEADDVTGTLLVEFLHNEDSIVRVHISGFKKAEQLPPEGEQNLTEEQKVELANQDVQNQLTVNTQVMKLHPIPATDVDLNNIGQYIDFLSGLNRSNRAKKVNDEVIFKLESVRAESVGQNSNLNLLVAYTLSTNSYTSQLLSKSVNGWASQTDADSHKFVTAVNSVHITANAAAKSIPATKIKNENDLKYYFNGIPSNNNIYTVLLENIRYVNYSQISFTYKFTSIKNPQLVLVRKWDKTLSNVNFMQGLLHEPIINTSPFAAPRELDVENVNYRPLRFTILYSQKTKRVIIQRLLVFATQWLNNYKQRLIEGLERNYYLPKDGWSLVLRADNIDWTQVIGKSNHDLWYIIQTDTWLNGFDTLVMCLRSFRAAITVYASHSSIPNCAISADVILTGICD